jgi:hypothetical protein
MDAAARMSTDEEDQQSEGSIANLANRKLLAIVADMRQEAHRSAGAMDRIYEALRGMPAAAPPAFAPLLLEEVRAQHAESGKTVERLREFVEGRQA